MAFILLFSGYVGNNNNMNAQDMFTCVHLWVTWLMVPKAITHRTLHAYTHTQIHKAEGVKWILPSGRHRTHILYLTTLNLASLFLARLANICFFLCLNLNEHKMDGIEFS